MTVTPLYVYQCLHDNFPLSSPIYKVLIPISSTLNQSIQNLCPSTVINVVILDSMSPLIVQRLTI